MSFMLVDSHTHLYDMKKDYILPGDIYPVVIGYSHSSNRKALETAKRFGYPFALGIAPQTAVKNGADKLDEWVDLIRLNKPNAIGEVGLDYKWATTTTHVEDERIVFSRMIDLAQELDLPLVIHSRDNPTDNEIPKDAIGEILSKLDGRRFLMHFYSGDDVQAKRIIDMGGYLSFTHMRSKEKRKVINTAPLDRLLIESDSPYIGRTPDCVREAAAYIAEVKGLDVSAVADATAKNAMRFFGFGL